jgi:DNA topoisomerase-1
VTKNLVIVESPSKSKTIEKYLGSDYKVVSSKGHIRDLATTGKYGLGVDIDDDFKPNYVPIPGKQKMISDLKKMVKDSDMIYLATDPDREGEAISWHLKEALNIKDNDYLRVLFHEITKDKVIEAFKEPRKIDYALVKSQETRRILDRIIGFRLSKLMQSKTGGKSAGRVQSVALKLIVDREREIENFNSEEYWTVTSVFDEFEASLFNYKGEEIKLTNEEETDKVINALGDDFTVLSIEQKEKNKKAKPPFITSTMQQDA